MRYVIPFDMVAAIVAVIVLWRGAHAGLRTEMHDALEPGTPAVSLTNHIADDIKESRRERLMQVQQKIAFAWNENMIGRQLKVLIDTPLPDGSNVWVGRTFADAPDVDSVVYVTGPSLAAGKFVTCEVVASQGYDLVAAAVCEPTD